MKLFIVALVVACASADVSHILSAKSSDAQAKILKQDLDVGVEGQFQYSYETENGIAGRAQGELKNVQAENPAQVIQGEAQWTAPNGELVQLQYTADENGYQPQGSHLPTPPPIPEAILRSIEFIRAHPPPPAQRK